ncbi:MAG: ABC-2 family transporter protein [Treponema sp.]|nr:ABC-2 family transporter protein [Treponema sp.]
MLWRYLYGHQQDMVAYMTKYTIIANIISMLYPRGIAGTISSRVYDGSFIIDLMRPVNFFAMMWQRELADICSRFLLRGVAVLLVYAPLLIENAGYYNILQVCIALLLGHVLFLLIYSLLGFSSFILIEIWPFSRLLDDTIRLLGGGFIPLAILPGGIRFIAEIMPFKYVYSFPLKLLFNDLGEGENVLNFAVLGIWIVIFSVSNLLMYRFAQRKITVQGG